MRQLARRHRGIMMMKDIEAKKLGLPRQRQADDKRAQPVRRAKSPRKDQIGYLCPIALNSGIIIPTKPTVRKSCAGPQAPEMFTARAGLQLKLTELANLLTDEVGSPPAFPR